MFGLRHGKGTYKYANGDVFVGNWARGVPDGEGTLKIYDEETKKFTEELSDEWNGPRI